MSVFANGDDGDAPTAAQKIEAWDRFSDRDQSSVRLLIGGGEESIAVQRKMYQICESRLDCFALLDTPANFETAGKAVDWRLDHQNFNTTFAALYPGRYRDQVEGSGVVEYVPRSGYEAAVIGLMDPEWLPPAGLRRGVIPVLGVSQSYTEAERGFLYNNDLNPYRVVPGQGIVTWGQKTLQGGQDTALSRINVRLMLIAIERPMGDALESFIHQLNTEFTRLQVTQVLTEFMQRIQVEGGVYDFLVVCDETNNTSAVIDANEMHVDVYVQPTRAAEFIRLQTVVTRTGASFSELVQTGGNFN